MTDEFKSLLSSSEKITSSDDWDAIYEELPVVIALSTNELQVALDKLDSVGGYGYIACLLYTSPSPRDVEESRMPSSA